MKILIRPERDRWASVLRRPSRSSREMVDVVEPIFRAVRTRGDAALRDFTRKFDGAEVEDFRVPQADLEASASLVPESVREAIDVAVRNIERFHRSQVHEEEPVETMPGVRCWRRSVPIRRVGLYVPGGSAPLLSTVLMLGIPARIAGCEEIYLCTPPGADGNVEAAILYSATVAGVVDIFKVGGAQAIAAFTYGTGSIPAVDKIFGPGNQYVTAAKQYAALEGVAIDMPAGPTEVAIVADGSCPPEFIVYDVLAQAEHGPDSHVILATVSESFAYDVRTAIEREVETIPRAEIAREALAESVIVVLDDVEAAVELCNEYAPEHLILATENAQELAQRVRAAGSVFVGHLTPESVGDYASGTNHTLPTGGAARAYSGVSVDSFVKKITFQELSAEGLQGLGPSVVTLAGAEQLDAHGRAVSVRLEGLG